VRYFLLLCASAALRESNQPFLLTFVMDMMNDIAAEYGR
jgi:hypothetical protein